MCHISSTPRAAAAADRTGQPIEAKGLGGHSTICNGNGCEIAIETLLCENQQEHIASSFRPEVQDVQN
jgi:hypothetical protein